MANALDQGDRGWLRARIELRTKNALAQTVQAERLSSLATPDVAPHSHSVGILPGGGSLPSRRSA